MKNLFILILICSLNCKAQTTIKGTVSDSNETVPFVNVLVKKLKTPIIIYKYTTTNENGFYEIILPIHSDSLIVEVTSPFHDPQQKTIFSNLKNNESRILNFTLQKRITTLKEVLLKAKEKAITKNGDTTTYNPDSFKDGTERVIEDLLRKLPGIKVEADGDIKFKGKSIKKMLLDGDDLFDAQYKIGSKNISIDMVDKVQAIEDFNENPLLKGIKDSNEVALNIKLKKGKNDFSGNSIIGYGIIDRYDTSISGLLINSKNKSFGVLKYNNIGNNPSPYNIGSDIVTTDNQSEEQEYAKGIITQGNFNSSLENQYSNISENFYSSLNSLFKVTKNVASRINVGLYADELSRSITNFSTYQINESTFNVNEIENFKKKPNIFNANFQLLNKSSKKQNWEYIGKIKFLDVGFFSESVNNLIPQTNIVKSKTFFTKHLFNYSTLINDKNILIFNALYSKSNTPQNYTVTPGLNISDNSVNQIIKNEQNSRFDKETLNFNTDFIGKYASYQWVIKTGLSSIKNQFRSTLFLTNNDNTIIEDQNFKNSLTYSILFPYTNLNLTFTKKKYTIKTGLGLRYYNITLNTPELASHLNNEQLVFLPEFTFVYKIARKSSLIFNYNFNQIEPIENFMFEGIVQTGYRTFQNNTANLNFLNKHNFAITYAKNFDLLNRFKAIASYTRSKNNYLTKSIINENTTTTSVFLADTKNDDYNFAVSNITYIHPIKTTIDLNITYNLNLFNNIINNSELRNVVNKSLNAELTMRRGIRKVMYFETKTIFFNSAFLLENESENKFNSLTESIKIAYNSEKSLKANTTISFVSTDLSLNNNYLFLNAELSFSSKNKKIEYSVIGRNLTNNNTFNTFSIQDFSATRTSQNLIERYILANVSFSF